MTLVIFYCLSTILLFVIVFTCISTFIIGKQPRFVHKVQVQIVKTHLEETYKLNTYQDALHK